MLHSLSPFLLKEKSSYVPMVRRSLALSPLPQKVSRVPMKPRDWKVTNFQGYPDNPYPSPWCLRPQVKGGFSLIHEHRWKGWPACSMATYTHLCPKKEKAGPGHPCRQVSFQFTGT